MKVLNILFCYLAIICLSNSYLFSLDDSTPPTSVVQKNESTKKKNSSKTVKFIELGIKGLSFDYKEIPPDASQPFKSEETGFLPGIFGSFCTNNYYDFFLSSNLDFNFGNQRYDGGIQNTKDSTYTAFSANHFASYFLFSLNLNYQIMIDDDSKLIPFIGFQIRNWDRDMSSLKLNGSQVGYQEVYKWNYFRFGTSVQFDLTPNDELTFLGSINLMYSGKMTAYLSEMYSGAPDLEFTLGNMSSSLFEISLKHQFNRKWALSISGFYDKYSFDQSPPLIISDYTGAKYMFVEPASKTTIYGLNIGLVYTLGK